MILTSFLFRFSFFLTYKSEQIGVILKKINFLKTSTTIVVIFRLIKLSGRVTVAFFYCQSEIGVAVNGSDVDESLLKLIPCVGLHPVRKWSDHHGAPLSGHKVLKQYVKQRQFQQRNAPRPQL